jgi:hypothetical protein
MSGFDFAGLLLLALHGLCSAQLPRPHTPRCKSLCGFAACVTISPRAKIGRFNCADHMP